MRPTGTEMVRVRWWPGCRGRVSRLARLPATCLLGSRDCLLASCPPPGLLPASWGPRPGTLTLCRLLPAIARLQCHQAHSAHVWNMVQLIQHQSQSLPAFINRITTFAIHHEDNWTFFRRNSDYYTGQVSGVRWWRVTLGTGGNF